MWHAIPPEPRLSAAVEESCGDGPDGRGRQESHGGAAGICIRGHCAVALVLLAEAHAALAAALGHADVVHHEHVYVNVVGAAAADLHVG